MPSTSIFPSHALLLLLASLVYAQDQPAQQGQPSPTSPPFPLDSNGEAHFNIPVVVKLADLNAAAAAAGSAVPGAVVHRRSADDDSPPANIAEDAESPQPIPAFDDSAAKIVLAQPAHIEPAFGVAHQGHDDTEGEAELEARNASYKPAAAAQFGMHTVLLVETVGTVISTVTDPCTDSSSISRAASAPNAGNTTTTTTATSTIHETAGLGKPPMPLNHTSYPLRNGTEGSLPCNSTGGMKPAHATGLGGAKPSGTGSLPVNPANGMGPSSRLTGDAAGVKVVGLVVLAVGTLVAALVF